MTPLIPITLLAFLGSILGLVGGVMFLVRREKAKHFCGYAIPFAAGVLISVAFLDAIPESLEVLGNKALKVVLLAFIFAFIFEEFFAGLHHHEEKKHTLLR